MGKNTVGMSLADRGKMSMSTQDHSTDMRRREMSLPRRAGLSGPSQRRTSDGRHVTVRMQMAPTRSPQSEPVTPDLSLLEAKMGKEEVV